MDFTFDAFAEPTPGERWKTHFERHRNAYRRWFLSDGDRARPSYLESVHALRQHMPELVATYERLVDLAGGGDVAARMLALYCPPRYLGGCSQAVWSDPGNRLLVRNYDYHPDLLEGAVTLTAWTGRQVLAVSDCLWGVLDGMNDSGLAVSLAFGGSRAVGEGFGIPLVLRYVLEVCDTTAAACRVLERVPIHMPYNVTVLDRTGRFCTVYLSPERAPVRRQLPLATNHQGSVEWLEHAHATHTMEREQFLLSRFADPDETASRFVDRFLRPPLFSHAYARGYGTLYTAVYRPRSGSLEMRWPAHKAWTQRLAEFHDGERRVRYVDGGGS